MLTRAASSGTRRLKVTLSPEQTDDVLRALRKGHTMTGAAGVAGISKSSLYLAMRADPVLKDEVRAAKHAGQALLERVVLAEAEHDGKLALQALKVRSKDWQERQRVELDVAKISDADLERRAMAIAVKLVERK